jgi:hypothetical protein
MPGKHLGKIFVFFTSFLFFGTAFIPVMNHQCVQASKNQDFISLTIEVNGKGNHTVRLSQEEYQDLTSYLDSFQETVQRTRSIEETKALYKEALQQFEKDGLLSKDMNTQELYSLICRNLPRQNTPKTLSFSQNQKENYLCLIAGRVTNMWCQNLIIQILFAFFYHIAEIKGLIVDKWLNFLGNHPLMEKIFFTFALMFLPFAYIAGFIDEMIGFLYTGSTVFSSIDPVTLAQLLGLGSITEIFPGHIEQDPSKGWISTIGLNGYSYDNGSFLGALPILPIFLGSIAIYSGIFDFTGIKILTGDPITGRTFFLGSALWVKYNCTA